MEGPHIVVDCNCDGSHHQRCGNEAEGRQEQPLAPRFREPALIHLPQPAVGNDRGEAAENRRDQDRQNPKTPMGPKHHYSDLGTPVAYPVGFTSDLAAKQTSKATLARP